MDTLLDLPTDQIGVVLIANSTERKQLHQYFEATHPQIHKSSLKLKSFPAERHFVFKECYLCDSRRGVPMVDYHMGSTSSNIDEWYSGECPKCEEIIQWEPNYEWNDVWMSFRNNAIAFGDYFRGYTPKHAVKGQPSTDQIQHILQSAKIFKVPAPSKQLNKRALQIYLDEYIFKIT